MGARSNSPLLSYAAAPTGTCRQIWVCHRAHHRYSEDEPVRDGGESEADSAPVRAAGAASTQSPDAGPGEHTMDGEHDAELEAASTALQLEGISGEVVDSLGLVAAEAKIMALLNKEGPAR